MGYQVYSNYEYVAKLVPPQGTQGKHEKIFLSGTTRPRHLIFGMKHHLVDLYQVCLFIYHTFSLEALVFILCLMTINLKTEFD